LNTTLDQPGGNVVAQTLEVQKKNKTKKVDITYDNEGGVITYSQEKVKKNITKEKTKSLT